MLDLSLTVTAENDSPRFALTVTNPATERVTLTFRTGQRAEFTVHEADDEASDGADDEASGEADDDASGEADDGVVWRYGEGRLFTQAIETETLDPGETATYAATWTDPSTGRYRVIGELLAEEATGTAVATVTVP